MDFLIIKDHIELLYKNNKREITYVIEVLKKDVQKLKVEVESFVQLSKYTNQSIEALSVSKSKIIEWCLRCESFSQRISGQTKETTNRSCTNGTYNYNVVNTRPCAIYLTLEKREKCGKTY